MTTFGQMESAPAILAYTKESENCWLGLWLTWIIYWNSVYFQLWFLWCSTSFWPKVFFRLTVYCTVLYLKCSVQYFTWRALTSLYSIYLKSSALTVQSIFPLPGRAQWRQTPGSQGGYSTWTGSLYWCNKKFKFHPPIQKFTRVNKFLPTCSVEIFVGSIIKNI